MALDDLKTESDEITLDWAEELFRDDPGPMTAAQYLKIAREYAADDMITDQELASIVIITAGWINSRSDPVDISSTQA